MKTQKEILAEIEALTSTAATPEEAIEKIALAYPEINVQELKKQFEAGLKQLETRFSSKASDEPEDLSDDALESVAGGSFSGWMKKNWPYVLGATAIIVGGAAIGIKLAGSPSAQNLSDAKGAGKMQGAHAGFDEGTNIGSDAAMTVDRNNPDTWTQALGMMGVKV